MFAAFHMPTPAEELLCRLNSDPKSFSATSLLEIFATEFCYR